MKIFYYCSTGTGPSLIAAAIHLSLLPDNRTPEAKELSALPILRHIEKKKVGNVLFIGEDNRGNQIYTFGLGKESALLKRAVTDLIEIYNKGSECILVDTSYADNRLIRWGQRFRGRLGLFFCLKGLRAKYLTLACTVRHTGNQVMSTRHPLTSTTTW